MALSVLKRAGLLVTLTPAVYVGLCACGTIGEVASRYINSAFVGDPVVKEEISKLYGWVQMKQKSSEPLYQLIDKEERAAFVRGEVTYKLLPAVEKIADKLEAKMAFNIWKQNCRRSMIANFQRRLK